LKLNNSSRKIYPKTVGKAIECFAEVSSPLTTFTENLKRTTAVNEVEH